jgi:type II secretory pathway pseudopilin PulG
MENEQYIKKNIKGFSLIEIAIMLVIVGILVGLGAGMMGSVTKQAKIRESRKTIDAAVESLIGYGAANSVLPVSGSFPANVKNPNDAWTKPFYYVVHTGLTSTAGGGVCGRKTSYFTVEICPDAACGTPTETINHVAFMVISGGGNYNNQTADSNTINSASDAVTTISIYDVDVSIDNYAGDINSADPYDDIIRWVTINELRTKAGCVGPQLKVVNNELPRAYLTAAYSATIFADGGVPFSGVGNYRWCRQESASTGLTFSPSTLNANCLGLAEGSWTQADQIDISGTPTATGSFNFTFFVRDDNDSPAAGTNDNITQKTLVLSVVNMACSGYRVLHNTGGGKDFRRDGVCAKYNAGEEITDMRFLHSGEDITHYSSSSGFCSGSLQGTLTYAQAQAADTNWDCCVNFTGTDYNCP